jgi:L-glyceraldehyde 3-phosphate reductase
MGALDYIVRSGRALYVGISNYSADSTAQAAKILRSLGTPCLIHQPFYNMFGRWIEDQLVSVLEQEGMGCIAFSPLAQGLLTDKYLHGIPDGSRASKPHGFLRPEHVTDAVVAKASRLNDLAQQRGQTLAQMALAWVLRLPVMTSALIGASRVEQVDEAVNALQNLTWSDAELQVIEDILKS